MENELKRLKSINADLLESLKGLVCLLDNSNYYNDIEIDKAREAIAKAEGK